MPRKKGVTPDHVKPKEFAHPAIEEPFIQALSEVEDPRGSTPFFRHSLTSILFMVIIAQICGATDWPTIVVLSNNIKNWLAKYVDISSGVPCERTFKNVMNMLDPNKMENLLSGLADEIREIVPQEVIAFDGQTCRGTANAQINVSPMHLVSAWSSDNGICLGQIKVDDKSNEITAVPQLMDQLDLKDTIITADAMNTQKVIAAKVIEKGGDYLLPIKGNHPTLLKEIKLAFEGKIEEEQKRTAQWKYAMSKAKENRDEPRRQVLLKKGSSACEVYSWKSELEKHHGRVELRTCTTISGENLESLREWANVQSLVRIERERTIKDKTSCETTYYISSLTHTLPEMAAEVARAHWSVENGLHWRLDVIFRQDKSRYRDKVGARNLAVIRKIVLNMLSKETSLKGSMKTKQFAACCNPAYREKIIKKLF